MYKPIYNWESAHYPFVFRITGTPSDILWNSSDVFVDFGDIIN